MYALPTHQPVNMLQDRKVVNAVYFLVPPLGMLMMCLSPLFSTKERLMRMAVTAAFLTFFAVMGPEMRAYLAAHAAAVAVH